MNTFSWKKYIVELSGGYDESKLKTFSSGNFYDENNYEEERKKAGSKFIDNESRNIDDEKKPSMNKPGIYAQPGNNKVDAGVFDRWWRPVIIDLQSASRDTARLALENKSNISSQREEIDKYESLNRRLEQVERLLEQLKPN